jgi:hypothetical protein
MISLFYSHFAITPMTSQAQITSNFSSNMIFGKMFVKRFGLFKNQTTPTPLTGKFVNSALDFHLYKAQEMNIIV